MWGGKEEERLEELEENNLDSEFIGEGNLAYDTNVWK